MKKRRIEIGKNLSVGAWQAILDALPPDTIVLSAGFAHLRGSTWLYVESDQFTQAGYIPELVVEWRLVSEGRYTRYDFDRLCDTVSNAVYSAR